MILRITAMDALFTCVLILCKVVVIRAATFECPANAGHDLHLFEQHCYQFITDHPGDWPHANADCIAKGGWLTDIHSASEQAFIYNSLKTLGLHGDKGVWIGLNDKDVEGTWKWTSGANVNYKHWASGQPGFLGFLEDCALLEVSSSGLWHDYACERQILDRATHGWVCKFAAIPVTNSTQTTSSMTSAGMDSSPSSTSPAISTERTTTQPMATMETDRPTDAMTPGTVTVIVTELQTDAVTTTQLMTSQAPTDTTQQPDMSTQGQRR